jgi:hypothetical protein
LPYWGLNSPWATPPALFLWRVFRDRVLLTICPGWLQTTILLISDSWVAKIIGVSHQHLARNTFLKKSFFQCWRLNPRPCTCQASILLLMSQRTPSTTITKINKC